MKITKTNLRKMIKEELKAITEGAEGDLDGDDEVEWYGVPIKKGSYLQVDVWDDFGSTSAVPLKVPEDFDGELGDYDNFKAIVQIVELNAR